MYKFVKTVSEKEKDMYNGLDYNQDADIEMIISTDDVTTDDLLENFKKFLMGCGFPVTWNETLKCVDEEEYEEFLTLKENENSDDDENAMYKMNDGDDEICNECSELKINCICNELCENCNEELDKCSCDDNDTLEDECDICNCEECDEDMDDCSDNEECIKEIIICDKCDKEPDECNKESENCAFWDEIDEKSCCGEKEFETCIKNLRERIVASIVPIIHKFIYDAKTNKTGFLKKEFVLQHFLKMSSKEYDKISTLLKEPENDACFEVDGDIFAKLAEQAHKEDISVNEYVSNFLKEYIKEYETSSIELDDKNFDESVEHLKKYSPEHYRSTEYISNEAKKFKKPASEEKIGDNISKHSTSGICEE